MCQFCHGITEYGSFLTNYLYFFAIINGVIPSQLSNVFF